MSPSIPPEPGRPGQPGEEGTEVWGGSGGEGGRGGKGGTGGEGFPGATGSRGRAGADSATSARWLTAFFVLFLATAFLIGLITYRQSQSVDSFRETVAELCLLRASQIDAMVAKDLTLAQIERSDPSPRSSSRVIAFEKEAVALGKVRDNCSGLLR